MWMGAGPNGLLMLAGLDGLGILCMLHSTASCDMMSSRGIEHELVLEVPKILTKDIEQWPTWQLHG
jgi:hypothetical protein